MLFNEKILIIKFIVILAFFLNIIIYKLDYFFSITNLI